MINIIYICVYVLFQYLGMYILYYIKKFNIYFVLNSNGLWVQYLFKNIDTVYVYIYTHTHTKLLYPAWWREEVGINGQTRIECAPLPYLYK
jgi:hypothetical protein